MNEATYRLNELNFFENPGHDTVYFRPTTYRWTDHESDRIEELREQHGDDNDTIAARLAPNMYDLEYSDTECELDNGYDTERYSFRLDLIVMEGARSRTRLLATGYTACDDGRNIRGNAGGINTDHRGDITSIDGRMRLYFNNVFTVVESVIDTDIGSQRRVSYAGGRRMLHRSTSDYYNRNSPRVYNGSLNMISAALSSSNSGRGTRPLVALSEVDAEESSIVNPTTYLSSAMKVARVARSTFERAEDNDEGFELDLDEEGFNTPIWTTARSVRNRMVNISVEEFVTKLGFSTDYANQGYITYDDLYDFVEGMERNVTVTPSNPDVPGKGFGNSWLGTSREHNIAFLASQIIAGYMQDDGIGMADFEMGNDGRGGATYVIPMAENSIAPMFRNVKLGRRIQGFMDRLEHELLPTLTRNGQIILNMRIQAVALVSTVIEVTLDGGDLEMFCLPNFCDSSYSSLLSDREEPIANVMDTIDHTAGEIIRGRNGNDDYADDAPTGLVDHRGRPFDRSSTGRDINEDARSATGNRAKVRKAF